MSGRAHAFPRHWRESNSGFGGEGTLLPDDGPISFPCPLLALADLLARESGRSFQSLARLRRTGQRGPVVAFTEQARLRDGQP
jgi:hypothetical protein